MGMTNAERQARFRAKKLDQGFKTVSVLVPLDRFADFGVALQMLRDNPDLEIGTLRNTKTGKLVSIRKGTWRAV